MKGSDRISSVGIREKLFGKNRWNIPLMVVAVLVLVGSFTALAYVKLTEEGTQEIRINDVTYRWEDLPENFNTTEIDGHTGYPLDLMIIASNVLDPEDHEYQVVGSDGYVRTFSWEDMEKGLLVEDGKKTVFPEKERAFWVQNVVRIEVV